MELMLTLKGYVYFETEAHTAKDALRAFQKAAEGAGMKPYIHNKLFDELYSLWLRYHLNDMHAGTPEQEAAIKEQEAKLGRCMDYDTACDYLKEIGLYEVTYTGRAIGREYKNEPYRYGSAWLIQPLPTEVIRRVIEIVKGNGGYVYEN